MAGGKGDAGEEVLYMKFIWQDYVVMAGFVLYLMAGFCTQYVLTEVGQLTEAASQLEANPIARQVVDFRFGLFLLQLLEISFMGGVYAVMRRKLESEPTEPNAQLLTFYVSTLLVMFLQNFVNDFGVFLKIFIG